MNDQVDECKSTDEHWRLTTQDRTSLAENSWFASLPTTLRHDLVRAIRVREFGAGEQVFATGAPLRSWWVCLGGAVRMGASYAHGRSLDLVVLRAGQWFGDLPLHHPAHCTHDATSLGPSRLGEVSAASMLSLVECHPRLHFHLYQWQSLRLESVFGLLGDHATLPLSIKIAKQLHRLAKSHGEAGPGGQVRIAISLSQMDVACLVGSSRQRANAELGELVRKDILLFEGGHYTIKNMAALCSIVDG
jgi:CRP-like cAMP-binding protein